MLAVIVFYLLYFGSINGKYIEKKCLRENSDCLVDTVCCSNHCLLWDGMTNGQCSSVNKPKDDVIVCLLNNHECSKDENCCSDNCYKVSGEDLGICISNVRNSVSVKINPCLGFGHICLSSNDCCSGNCKFARTYFTTLTAYACYE